MEHHRRQRQMTTAHEALFLLQEAFPQVDNRILKATALQHRDDIDAAANFILSEILPHLSEPAEPRFPLDHSKKTEAASPQDDLNEFRLSPSNGPDKSMAGCSTPSTTLECNEGCNESVAPCFTESNENNFPLIQEVTDKDQCFTGEKSLVEIESEVTSSNNPTASEEVHSVLTANLCSTEYADSDSEGRCKQESFIGQTNFSQNDLKNDVQISSASNDTKYIIGPATIAPTPGNILDVGMAETTSYRCFIDDPVVGLSPTLFLETNIGFQENGLSYSVDHEGSSQHFQENANSDFLSNSILSANEEQSSTTSGSRPDQILSIDALEDFINDAKRSKHTLTSAIESIVSLVKEVEIREEEALRAKDESLKAGLDIIAKTEDLKKMLIHAKETNDMQTGELYGEKSILATEAREFQSRLLGLANERDRTLSTIEEMRATLESRLAAAEAESVAAKEERLGREEMALKLFKEQENMMDVIVKESQRLQQLADENSKLREFLVDRGRIVDTLQGEFSVICEDVVSLKECVDGRVPFDKFLHSKPTSLTSSMRSSMSDNASEQVEFTDKTKTIGGEASEKQDQDHANELDMPTSGGVRRENVVSSDDEWQMFDKDGSSV